MINPSKTSRLGRILLVEDNQNDMILMRAAFERAKFAVELHHVINGQQCLDFLRKQGRFTDCPTPDLILLDLNMPVMDGREVLEEMVSDDDLKHLPVVILTTSADERDILDMYKLRCSSYIVKPVDFDQFTRVVRDLSGYWFTIVALPSEDPAEGLDRE